MTIEYGLLSTHPPTRCGLATFNSALAAQLTIAGVSGGVVFAIVDELEIPVLFVGTGEQLGDLSEFDAEAFVRALFKT